jgi:hypothetical protein
MTTAARLSGPARDRAAYCNVTESGSVGPEPNDRIRLNGLNRLDHRFSPFSHSNANTATTLPPPQSLIRLPQFHRLRQPLSLHRPDHFRRSPVIRWHHAAGRNRPRRGIAGFIKTVGHKQRQCQVDIGRCYAARPLLDVISWSQARNNLTSVSFGRRVTEPRQGRSQISHRLVRVVAVVMFGLVWTYQGRYQGVHLGDHRVDLVRLPKPGPRPTLLSSGLNRRRTTGRSNRLCCPGQLQRLGIVALGQHPPSFGFKTPSVDFVVPGVPGQTGGSSKSSRSRRLLLEIDMDGGRQQRQPTAKHQQPAMFVECLTGIEQPIDVGKMLPNTTSNAAGGVLE